jgi:ribonuclease P protein component
VAFSSIKIRRAVFMKYSESLKKNADFNLVYQSGRSLANKYLVMYVRENGVNKNKLGISVSKKVGNSIVRHRLTRLVRESYRLQEDHFRCGLDIVVIARNSAKDKGYREIESALIHLGNLHKIYTEVMDREKDNDCIHQVLS